MLGLSVAYASVVGRRRRRVPAAEPVGHDRQAAQIPDTVDEFTGYFIAIDLIAWSFPGDQRAGGLPRRSATRRCATSSCPPPTATCSCPPCRSCRRTRRRARCINAYAPGKAGEAGLENDRLTGALWAADVWYSIKKHWVTGAAAPDPRQARGRGRRRERLEYGLRRSTGPGGPPAARGRCPTSIRALQRASDMAVPLQGKVALVTGAARGIGRAIARKLAAARLRRRRQLLQQRRRSRGAVRRDPRRWAAARSRCRRSVGMPDSVDEMFERARASSSTGSTSSSATPRAAC